MSFISTFKTLTYYQEHYIKLTAWRNVKQCCKMDLFFLINLLQKLFYVCILENDQYFGFWVSLRHVRISVELWHLFIKLMITVFYKTYIIIHLRNITTYRGRLPYFGTLRNDSIKSLARDI
jgi:hypothetical protein